MYMHRCLRTLLDKLMTVPYVRRRPPHFFENITFLMAPRHDINYNSVAWIRCRWDVNHQCRLPTGITRTLVCFQIECLKSLSEQPQWTLDQFDLALSQKFPSIINTIANHNLDSVTWKKFRRWMNVESFNQSRNQSRWIVKELRPSRNWGRHGERRSAKLNLGKIGTPRKNEQYRQCYFHQ